MDWKEAISKARLAEANVDVNLHGEQIGGLNVKIGDTNNIYVPSNPEAARAFGEGLAVKLSEVEARAKDEAIRKLESLGPAIDLLSTSTQTELASAALATAAAEKVFGSGNITVPVPKMRGTGRSVVKCKKCETLVDIEYTYSPKCGTKIR